MPRAPDPDAPEARRSPQTRAPAGECGGFSGESERELPAFEVARPGSGEFLPEGDAELPAPRAGSEGSGRICRSGRARARARWRRACAGARSGGATRQRGGRRATGFDRDEGLPRLCPARSGVFQQSGRALPGDLPLSDAVAVLPGCHSWPGAFTPEHSPPGEKKSPNSSPGGGVRGLLGRMRARTPRVRGCASGVRGVLARRGCRTPRAPCRERGIGENLSQRAGPGPGPVEAGVRGGEERRGYPARGGAPAGWGRRHPARPGMDGNAVGGILSPVARGSRLRPPAPPPRQVGAGCTPTPLPARTLRPLRSGALRPHA